MDMVEHRPLPPEQYVALEVQSPLRHEYVAGEAHAINTEAVELASVSVCVPMSSLYAGTDVAG